MQGQQANTGAGGWAGREIELGRQVYDALERPLGNVADVEHERGQLRIDGRPIGFEFFEVPLSAVKEVKGEDVYLSLQLDARSAASDKQPRWSDEQPTVNTAIPRASSAERNGGPASVADRSSSWSPTIEHPNIVKVGETREHDVPIWNEGRASDWSSYAPWAGAVGLGAASAVGYYWWRQSRRKSSWERALDAAGGAFGYAGERLEPVYGQAREHPGWAAALATPAALALAAYLRHASEQESTVEAARNRLKDSLPFGSRGDWRDTAASWWDSAPSVRDSAASLWDAAPSLSEVMPSLGRRRSSVKDYLTREEESDWLTWPLAATLLGMVVGALWYLLSKRSEEGNTGRTIRDVMTARPEVIRPDSTVFEAASLMRRLDVGAVPVCDGARLQGMLTDRDIAVRSAAEGKDPHLTLVRDVMTNDVTWAYEDEPVERAADLMQEHQIRRLPIVSRQKHLVGIVSLGDIAVDAGDDRLSGSTLEQVSEPSRPGR